MFVEHLIWARHSTNHFIWVHLLATGNYYLHYFTEQDVSGRLVSQQLVPGRSSQ